MTLSENSSFRLALGVFLLGLVLAIPTGIPAWFDGLSWDGRWETLVVVIVIPFLLVLGRKFLSHRLPTFLLISLLILKIFLFAGAPAGGWLVKVEPTMSLEKLGNYGGGFCLYFTPQATDICEKNHPIININKKGFEEGRLETYATFWNKEASGILQTYATFWNKEASGILLKPWTDKLDFPIEWAIPFPVKDYEKLNPIFKIKGTLLLPKGKNFSIVAEGLEAGSLVAINENEEIFDLLPAKNFKEAAQHEFQLPEGIRWQVSGNLKYAGKDWSLIPVLIDENGKVSISLGRDILWQNESVLSLSSGRLQFYQYISWVVDAGICVLFLIWSLWTVRFQIQEKVLTLPLGLFSIFAAAFPIVMAPLLKNILEMVHVIDATNVSLLGISITVTATGFLLWNMFRKDYWSFQPERMGRTLFILFGPAMLFFFTNKWWYQIELWWGWAVVDDWSAYQYSARRIIVGGEWLTGGEPALMGREFYPYFVAIHHMLFGKSSFSTAIADVWSVLIVAILLASLAIKFRLSLFTAYICSTIFLIIFLIGSFRYHIGRGLSEITAMIFMMLAAWYLYRAREGGAYRVVLATFFGILGYWARQDHLGVIAGLAILILEPIEGPTGEWKGYWARFKIKWKQVVCYWGGGIVIGVGLICVRNWFIGIGFRISGPTPNFGYSDFLVPLKSFYLILTGNTWPHFPSISGFVMTLGTLIALIALVWHRKPLLNFPISIGISILALFAPYLFVKIWAYPPRFSIHLLPLALFSLMIFLNQYLKDIPIFLKLNEKK